MNRFLRGPLYHLEIAVLLSGLLQVVAPSAYSQGLLGTWKGDLSTLQGTLPLEFDLTAGGGGTVKSPSQNFTSQLQYSSSGSQLTIRVPSVNGTFNGTVNGNQATGTWTQNGMSLPLTLTKSGAAGANPAAGNGEGFAGGDGGGSSGGVDVAWKGDLSTPQGTLPLEFDLTAGGGGTVKSPSQNFTSQLQYSSSGSQLTIHVPSVNGTFSGTVNGNQATGTWTQNGMSLPLTLSK